MAFEAGDITIQGGPPAASDLAPGGLWLHVFLKASDTDQLTVGVDAYSYSPPLVIDWGDGTRGDHNAFAKVVGAGGAPDVYSAAHAYERNTAGQSGYVENGVRARFQVRATQGRNVIGHKFLDAEVKRNARTDMATARGGRTRGAVKAGGR